MFNQSDLETEYKSCKKFILYASRFECDALIGTARMKAVRKELKSRHKSEYPSIIEMYDIITMIVTQRINVERLNSARAWIDDKTQRASCENLNDSLGLWHGKERTDTERYLINDDLIDLIDLINFCTFCLFIKVYFLRCGVILFVFSCLFVVFDYVL